ncbi:MAG: tetratricopeptide repeat protein [Azospirillaceae bacterium]
MIIRECRGLALSAGSAASAAAHDAAVRQFNTYVGDPVATIDAALAEDPEFVSGLVLRGHMTVALWEASVLPDLRATLDRLRALEGKATERERAHAAALSTWAEGDWEGYRARLDRLLVDHPRDLLALQIGHLSDFFHGDRDALRGRIARALPAWDRETPGYGFVLGMLAFGEEECADYRRAEETGRLAIAHEEDDAWAQHAVAHVMEMQGRVAEGVAWMRAREAHWAQEGNAFSFHNWWHTALYHLDLGETDRVLELYDTAIRPADGRFHLEMLDAAALLWRLTLLGHDVGGRWARLADTYAEVGGAGFYAFNDMHALMAFVGSGRPEAAHAWRRVAEATVEGAAGAGGTSAAMMREVGLPVLAAIEAFGAGDWETVIDRLMAVRYRAHRFGGSHAQRDILHRTLIEAALRAGRRPLAEALLAERLEVKPGCLFAGRQLARARSLPEAGRAAA